MLKTNNGRLLAVEELSWDNVVTSITPINPSLAKTMQLLKNNSEYVFYKASYRFGDTIISGGKCYLPLADGGCIAFDDSELPEALLNGLRYDKNEDPLAIVISKNSEFYLSGADGIQTQSITHPGQMFGIPNAIDGDMNAASTSVLELNLNAGSRSLFMLSKISDHMYHRKLQEHYGTTIPAPSKPQDHWELFVDIVNKANCMWRGEIIYFSRKWINKLKSFEWAALANCLMHIHRGSYSVWHKVSDAWNQTFHAIERDKKFSNFYSMPSVNTAKQLFMLAAGITYGFKPATDDEAAPISLIVDAYTNVYNKLAKQKYTPIIMEAAKFNIKSKYPIYYSINHSTSTHDELEASKNKSQIARVDEIRRIIESYVKAILEDKKNVPTLHNIAERTTFSYYHTNPDNYEKIHSVAPVPNQDCRFTGGSLETFPANSLFFRGCIKVSRIQ